MNLQEKLHVWRQRNFPDADATQQLLGIAEECGELAHAHLKQMQDIRGTVIVHEVEAKDAVGDLTIYLMGYCSCRGWDYESIVWDTAAHVMDRNWIKYPETGKPPTTKPSGEGSIIDGGYREGS